jgi:hypothetical protein
MSDPTDLPGLAPPSPLRGSPPKTPLPAPPDSPQDPLPAPPDSPQRSLRSLGGETAHFVRWGEKRLTSFTGGRNKGLYGQT